MVRHARLDDHAAAMFGLLMGTLAVLVSVLVFSVYDKAQDASQSRQLSPSRTITQQR